MKNNIIYGIGIECEFPIFLNTNRTINNIPVYMPLTNLFNLNINKKISEEQNMLIQQIEKMDNYGINKNIQKKITDNYAVIDLVTNMLNADGTFVGEKRLTFFLKIRKILNIIEKNQIEIVNYINDLLIELHKKYSTIKINFYHPIQKLYQFSNFIKYNENGINELINNALNTKLNYTIIMEQMVEYNTILEWNLELEKLGEYIKNQYDIDCEYISIEIEDDGEISSRFEIKNCSLNKKINEAINQIETIKSALIKYIFNLFPNDIHKYIYADYQYTTYPYIFDYTFSSDPDDFLKNVQESKCGSYHINLTLPYDINDTKDISFFNKFNERHRNLAKMIQTLEPIFMAVLTNVSFDSFYGSDTSIKNSKRLFNKNNKNMNLLTKDLDKMYPISINKKIDHEEQRYSNKPGDWNFLSYVLYELFIKTIKDDKIEDIIDYLQGTDFRINEQFYNPSKGKYFGFEFRFLDLFPTIYLKPIIQLFFMLAEYIENESINVRNPLYIFNDGNNVPIFGEILLSIIKNGWNVKPAKEYIELLNEYKFSINTNNHENMNNYYDLINHIFKFLQKQCNIYKNNNTLKYFIYVDNINDFEKDIGKFPNINKESYNMFMKMKEPNIYNILAKIGIQCTESENKNNCIKNKLHDHFPNDNNHNIDSRIHQI